MKKIFILPILIAPIMAHATDPVGPSAVGKGETPVVATANAPYKTAGAETGDTTNVVSASYVKGAYNDAIAAINKLNVDKQDKLTIQESGYAISDDIIGVGTFDDYMRQTCDNNNCFHFGNFENNLITADAVAAGIGVAINRRGVSAVTSWEDDDNITVLNFVPNND